MESYWIGGGECKVLEGAIKEADEIMDQGLNNKWLNLWKDSTLEEELRKLEEKNEVFQEFLR